MGWVGVVNYWIEWKHNILKPHLHLIFYYVDYTNGLLIRIDQAASTGTTIAINRKDGDMTIVSLEDM